MPYSSFKRTSFIHYDVKLSTQSVRGLKIIYKVNFNFDSGIKNVG